MAPHNKKALRISVALFHMKTPFGLSPIYQPCPSRRLDSHGTSAAIHMGSSFSGFPSFIFSKHVRESLTTEVKMKQMDIVLLFYGAYDHK